jgi:ubiquitin carboxyl-terminal hydrolase 48
MPRSKKQTDELTLQSTQLQIERLTSRNIQPDEKLQLAASGPLPVCEGSCRGNNKANPNCFCGWVPAAETGFKKKGLWQKDMGILSSLGADPRVNVRGVGRRFVCSSVLSISCPRTHALDPTPIPLVLLCICVCTSVQEEQLPCGLNNLGNTCYVNTALQCLFMIPSFRRALFEVQPPAADHKVVLQLRSLFLALAFGPQRSADPSAFAKCLNLDHSTQQVRLCMCVCLSLSLSFSWMHV